MRSTARWSTCDADTLVTVVAAKLTGRPDDDGLLLRWCNAGHPAPVLVRADGSVELLARAPDRLLGVGRPVARTDHVLFLAAGDTVLLYTDGLVEAPDLPLDTGTAELVAALSRRGAGSRWSSVCDELLAGLGSRHDDDVALLALRIRA